MPEEFRARFSNLNPLIIALMDSFKQKSREDPYYKIVVQGMGVGLFDKNSGWPDYKTREQCPACFLALRERKRQKDGTGIDGHFKAYHLKGKRRFPPKFYPIMEVPNDSIDKHMICPTGCGFSIKTATRCNMTNMNVLMSKHLVEKHEKDDLKIFHVNHTWLRFMIEEISWE